MSQVYTYTECGLDNVRIENMLAVIKDDAGEEVFHIPNIVRLHKVIAHGIIVSDGGISPKELRFLRTELGMTQAELAELVKKDHQTVGRWERGEKPIDANAELVIRMHAAEKLNIDVQMSVEEMSKNCVLRAGCKVIRIDGSDPDDYQLLAA